MTVSYLPWLVVLFPLKMLERTHCMIFLDYLAEELQIKSQEYSNSTSCMHTGMFRELWHAEMSLSGSPISNQGTDPIHTASDWVRERKKNTVAVYPMWLLRVSLSLSCSLYIFKLYWDSLATCLRLSCLRISRHPPSPHAFLKLI